MAIGKARRWIANFISGGMIDGLERQLEIACVSMRIVLKDVLSRDDMLSIKEARIADLTRALDEARPKPKLPPHRDATGRFAKRPDIEWSGYAETMD